MFDIITKQNATIVYQCINNALSNAIADLETERTTLRGHAKGMVTKQINKCLTAQIISEKAQTAGTEEQLEWALVQAEKALGYDGCFLRDNIRKAIAASEQEEQASEQTEEVTMLSKITLQAIATMGAVKRGELLTESLHAQKYYLQESGKMLARGNTEESHALQHKWLIEHRAYKTALKIQGGLM